MDVVNVSVYEGKAIVGTYKLLVGIVNSRIYELVLFTILKFCHADKKGRRWRTRT